MPGMWRDFFTSRRRESLRGLAIRRTRRDELVQPAIALKLPSHIERKRRETGEVFSCGTGRSGKPAVP